MLVEQNGKAFILKRELLRPRTLFSFALALVLLYFFVAQTSLGELLRRVDALASAGERLYLLCDLLLGKRWHKASESTACLRAMQRR